MPPVLEALGLTKAYGATEALKEVSFSIEPGDAVALIGPNGAGKTTLLRILSTLLKPTGGYAKVLGHDGRFEASKIRRVLGYMPDVLGTYEDLTVREYLEFFASCHGIVGEKRDRCVEGLLLLLDLKEIEGRLCPALSRGMQQRVGLARTLVHDPQILLLDEPAANLDARSRIEIREVLKELRNMGKTLLVSSHILRELGELCSRLLVLDRGRVVFSGSLEALAQRMRAGREVALRTSGGGGGGPLREALLKEPGVASAAESDGWLRVRLREGVLDHGFLARRVLEAGLSLVELRVEEPGLEDLFLGLLDESKMPSPK